MTTLTFTHLHDWYKQKEEGRKEERRKWKEEKNSKHHNYNAPGMLLNVLYARNIVVLRIL